MTYFRGAFALGLAALVACGLAGCSCTPHVTDSSGAAGQTATGTPASNVASSPVSQAASESANPLPPLTVAEVQRVLASFDTPDPSYASYALDPGAYSASIISQGPIYVDTSDPTVAPSTYSDPTNPTLKALPTDKAQSLLAEALGVYHALERTKGRTAALAEMNAQGMGGSAGDAPPTRNQLLLALLDEPLVTTGFMFGKPARGQWTWTVTKIDITGPATARVTYRVAAPPKSVWRFTTARQVKQLQFELVPSRGWVLAGWPDYVRFERAFRASVKPASAIPDQDLWWESIGQTSG